MSKKRVIGLDIFRVLAVLVVFLFHSQLFLNCDFGPLKNFVSMGAIFMTGFFMLSGFVLHQVYGNENLTQINALKKFYLKRAIGILPVYYFFAIVFVLFFGNETLKENIILAPIEILGLQSAFATLFTISHNDGSWFISCLLLCYLAFPFIQEIAKQISSRAKILLIILSALILCWSPFVVHQFHTASIYENPFFRGLEFLIGVLLCSLRGDASTVKFEFLCRWKFFFAELALFIAAVSAGIYKGVAPGNFMLYNFVALPAFASMLWTLSGVQSSLLENSKVLQFSCRISYAFFLAQSFCWIPVFKVQDLSGIHSGLLDFTVASISCTLIATAMHLLVERPASKVLQQKMLK